MKPRYVTQIVYDMQNITFLANMTRRGAIHGIHIYRTRVSIPILARNSSVFRHKLYVYVFDVSIILIVTY